MEREAGEERKDREREREREMTFVRTRYARQSELGRGFEPP
jgi:hypothetical protein